MGVLTLSFLLASLNLTSILESIEKLFNDPEHIEQDNMKAHGEALRVFNTLCEDFPGAVAVRSSYADFQNLFKQMASTTPDLQPQTYSGEAAHPSRPTKHDHQATRKPLP
jgi:hypothetical protein